MSFQENHTLETYKSLISVSMEGLKTLLLINGGAVVAMLAFLGQSPQGQKVAPYAWWPLGLFVGGVTCCAFAFLASYATQLTLYNESVFGDEYDGPSHTKCLWFAVGLVILSLVCFAAGAFSSVAVLARHTGPDAAATKSPTPVVPAASGTR